MEGDRADCRTASGCFVDSKQTNLKVCLEYFCIRIIIFTKPSYFNHGVFILTGYDIATVKKTANNGKNNPFSDKEEYPMKKRMIAAILTMMMLAASLAACSTSNDNNDQDKDTKSESAQVVTMNQNAATAESQSGSGEQTSTSEAKTSTVSEAKSDSSSDGDSDAAYTGGYSGGKLDTTDMFSKRDMKQEADVSDAKTLTVSDSKNVTVSEEGVYIISGTAKNASIIVDAADDAKVQLVLSGVSITNDSSPAIYVKNADKVFVTTQSGSTNALTVSGAFSADGDTNTDAVIFSKDDLVFNGKGTLTISSTDNGISGKDDIKITGGTINITSTADAIEANDSIVMADGNITITADKDGFHAENDEDDSVGYIYIGGGSVNITAGSDGIQATTVLQIDGGTITTNSSEGLEATYIQINGGTVNITASDDGINASNKSNAYSVTAEFNGGNINIDMGQGDTDAIDSNGDLYINGGTFNINANSPFDYDGNCEYNGGTIYVNGELTEEITNQMMGGGPGGGGHGGGPGGDMGGDMGGGPNG